MWVGLVFSYSQSSMVALMLVTLALALVTGDRRVRRPWAAWRWRPSWWRSPSRR